MPQKSQPITVFMQDLVYSANLHSRSFGSYESPRGSMFSTQKGSPNTSPPVTTGQPRHGSSGQTHYTRTPSLSSSRPFHPEITGRTTAFLPAGPPQLSSRRRSSLDVPRSAFASDATRDSGALHTASRRLSLDTSPPAKVPVLYTQPPSASWTQHANLSRASAAPSTLTPTPSPPRSAFRQSTPMPRQHSLRFNVPDNDELTLTAPDTETHASKVAAAPGSMSSLLEALPSAKQPQPSICSGSSNTAFEGQVQTSHA